MYLSTKNLKYKKKNKKRNKKFDSIKIESFFIKTVKKSINYELNLSTDVKVFSVFHVFLLKSVDSNTSIQNIFHYEIQKNDEYEIEKILNNQNQKYFIKWKNYSIEDNTWEHFNNFTNCSRKLRDYHQKKNDVKNHSSKSLKNTICFEITSINESIFSSTTRCFVFFQFFDVSQFFIHYNTLFFFHIINLTK